MSHRTPLAIGRILTVILFTACALLAIFRSDVERVVLYAQEEARYERDPSAQRAMAYGDAHFDAMQPALYDMSRAARFFTDASIKDPRIPYVFHQLARIAFLRGNFDTAMYYINKEIALHGDSEPKTYYMRGLIEGFMGKYDASAKDYEHFLKSDPKDWAGINDYAWVLLKAGRFKDAEQTTTEGLKYFPDNAWLLNSNATALYELGRYTEASAAAHRASAAASHLTSDQWLLAYPGNDPAVAKSGVSALQNAVQENLNTIQKKMASSTKQ